MIIRCVPTMQQASCQVPGWPKMSKQQMCPRTSARSPYSSATRFTASTSHLGAVANSATSSMSRFSLIGMLDHPRGVLVGLEHQGERALGGHETVTRRRVGLARHVFPLDAPGDRTRCAGFPGSRSRPAADRSIRPAAASGRWGTVQVIGSSPKCSKHAWLDMPPMYLSRKYGIRWWVVTGSRSATPRSSAVTRRCFGVIVIGGFPPKMFR